MNCPVCEGALPKRARFCPTCGGSLNVVVEGELDPLRAALESAIGFQYRIERLLGRGGMGAVYFAHELALDREVAVKVLRPEQAGSPESRERFRREARTAARLNHPHIVPLYTFGEVGGLVYFVMGYVRGESLASRLKRAGQLGVGETRRLLSEIADALDYAHRQGVVHRDIKPDNILIDDDSGRPLLTDFGVAKAERAGAGLTGTGHIVGTPHFMSPEQASGRSDVDARSDLYSLGIMGYAMLSGRLPFEGNTPAEVLLQHLTQDPVPLRSVTKGVPEDLIETIARCMSKDPAARWPTARSLRDALAPDGSREPEQPDELKALRGGILGAVFGLVAVGYAILRRGIDPAEFVQMVLFQIGGVCLVVALGMAVQLHQRHAMGWSAIFHKALEPPRWWPLWYPPPLRRKGDMWDRLPGPIRLFRNVCLLSLFYTGLVILPSAILMTAADEQYEKTGRQTALRAFLYSRQAVDLELTAFLVLVGFLAVEPFLVSRRLPLGITPHPRLTHVWEALLAPAWMTSFWSREPFHSMLVAERGSRVELGAAAKPEELEVLIAQIGQRLPAELRELGTGVIAAARSLSSAARALDLEMANLEKDPALAGMRDLEGRLTSLGPESPQEPDERREIRGLISRQVAILKRLSARGEDARQERLRATALLRTLYSELVGLSDEASRDMGSTGDRTRRLKELCRDIALWAPSATPTTTLAAPRREEPTRVR